METKSNTEHTYIKSHTQNIIKKHTQTHIHIHTANLQKGAPAKSAVIPIKSNRQMLLQFHSEYTSITDELENVCQMITSPTLSLNREPTEKPCSTAEFAALLEAKHLHECEESDYLMLSKLFQNRDSVNDSDDALGDVCHRFSYFWLLFVLFFCKSFSFYCVV